MKALVYSAPEKFEIKELPTPKIKPNQVLVRVKACGICKTDVHIHRGKFLAKFPLIPGHEFAGEVEKVGEGIKGFEPRNRVTADSNVFCGNCYYCRIGKPLFCENLTALGCNAPGGFAEYVVVNADKVFHLPDHLSYEEAIFIEPTACVVHCMDVTDFQPGNDVLLFGAGPAGLILAQMIKHCGASNLAVAAPTESKLQLAKKLGADFIAKIDRSDPSRGMEEVNRTFPNGFDVVVDATGVSRVVERCPRFVKYGGKVVFFGVCREEERISVSPYEVYRKELKLIGSFAQAHCFDRALKYLTNGIVKVKELVTHTFPLEDYAKAISTELTSHERIKVLIRP